MASRSDENGPRRGGGGGAPAGAEPEGLPGGAGEPRPHETARDGDALAEPGRGRCAASPRDIPLAGWGDILWRTWRGFNRDSIAIVARSIAFSAIFSLFPALAAFVSLFGLFADPAAVRDQLGLLAGVLPPDALDWAGDEVQRLAAQGEASLSLTFLAALGLAIWSVNASMKALVRGLNIAYGEPEKRGFVRLNLLTLAFSLAAFAVLLLASLSVVVAPIALTRLPLGDLALSLGWARWPILLLVALAGATLVYRYGPSRERARWRWVTWGGAFASVVWLLGSFGFSWYVARFAAYDATYGSLGTAFGFLTWVWMTSVVVLLGAKLNAEIEHQTTLDSTTGAPEPRGRRGAFVADTIGRAVPDRVRALIARRLPFASAARRLARRGGPAQGRR